MSLELNGLAGRPVVVGGGIAGLLTALHLAPEPVILVSKSPLERDSSSALAQGGVAAGMGPDDNPELHGADTLKAGDGLCDAAVVRLVTEAAPHAIETLLQFGVAFDRADDGRLLFGLEAAHSRRRILHAAGDGTGREIMRALAAAVRRTPSIAVIEGIGARQLVLRDGAISGVVVGDAVLPTDRVVIATGGLGGLFPDTTNPPGSFGQGLALAARAGAALADLEFMQFHPTALDIRSRPMPLISEAVRGEGAVLIDETGRRFLAGMPGAELAPRDAVARAIAAHIAQGHRAFIDARSRLAAGFAARFPTIDGLCRSAGIDPTHDPIPVRPAAHYHMGGIAVDDVGRASIDGLWAVGEVACTGLHGANRLASNSLLEAAVFARRVADSVAGAPRRRLRPANTPAPRSQSDPAMIRPIVASALGLIRTGRELTTAAARLLPLATRAGPQADPALVALMVVVAAMGRRESRGAHFRSDFPNQSAARRSRLTASQALDMARGLSGLPSRPIAEYA
jgi:L-aspartate oxidase